MKLISTQANADEGWQRGGVGVGGGGWGGKLAAIICEHPLTHLCVGYFQGKYNTHVQLVEGGKPIQFHTV